MKTLSSNIEVTEDVKANGNLKEDFKLNAQVNFMKSLMDEVKNGLDITIKKLVFKRQNIEVSTDVQVIDPDTQKKSILKEKVTKDCYNCICVLDIHEYVPGYVKKIDTELKPKVINGKDIISQESRIPAKNTNLKIK